MFIVARQEDQGPPLRQQATALHKSRRSDQKTRETPVPTRCNSCRFATRRCVKAFPSGGRGTTEWWMRCLRELWLVQKSDCTHSPSVT